MHIFVFQITTNSQEAAAKHEASRREQEAKGLLERQRIKDDAEAEEVRKQLLLLQAESSAVEVTGQAKAEAQSRAESALIEGRASVEQGIDILFSQGNLINEFSFVQLVSKLTRHELKQKLKYHAFSWHEKLK